MRLTADRTLAALLVAGIGLCLNCGSGDSNGSNNANGNDAGSTCADVEEYFAGIQKVGPNGIAVKILDSKPAPPGAGDNTWTIELDDSSRVPQEGANVLASPWMPKHKHGTPPPNVMPLGNGKYELKPVQFTMSGVWQVAFDIKTSAGTTDRLLFELCIKG